MPTDTTVYGGAIFAFVVLGFIIAIVLFLYLLPSFIAHQRNHQNAAAITALNILLGWAFIGWVGALVWALTEVKSRDNRHYHYYEPRGPGGF